VRDWLVIRLSDAYGETTWVRYSSVFFGVALLLIVLRRFRAASVLARGSVAALAERVAQRERELAATYAELEAAARDQARTHERERILREMHDGMGSHITSAIRQLQSGQTSSGDLLRTLRDSLDQLKLQIDSIHLPASINFTDCGGNSKIVTSFTPLAFVRTSARTSAPSGSSLALPPASTR